MTVVVVTRLVVVVVVVARVVLVVSVVVVVGVSDGFVVGVTDVLVVLVVVTIVVVVAPAVQPGSRQPQELSISVLYVPSAITLVVNAFVHVLHPKLGKGVCSAAFA